MYRKICCDAFNSKLIFYSGPYFLLRIKVPNKNFSYFILIFGHAFFLYSIPTFILISSQLCWILSSIILERTFGNFFAGHTLEFAKWKFLNSFAVKNLFLFFCLIHFHHFSLPYSFSFFWSYFASIFIVSLLLSIGTRIQLLFSCEFKKVSIECSILITNYKIKKLTNFTF